MRMALGLGLALAAMTAQGQIRTVAITVDDLVCASCAPATAGEKALPREMLATNLRLIAGLRKAHVPVTGFVITKSVEDAGAGGGKVLEAWLDADSIWVAIRTVIRTLRRLRPMRKKARLRGRTATCGRC